VKRVLLACYGGGHVQSLLPLAKRLTQNVDVQLQILPFTTARQSFVAAGLSVLPYSTMLCCLDQERSERLLSLAGVTAHAVATHADVPLEETLAYHAVGLHDLAVQHGDAKALDLFAQHGRAVFCPVVTFKAWLAANPVDLVVTSSSPRSELALQRAARQLGIAGLAVSDLFLQRESAYICDPGYAPAVTVINDYVADVLRAGGFESESHRAIHITGNPAFDRLFEPALRFEGQALRARLGLVDGDVLVSYYAPPAAQSLLGESFLPLHDVVNALDRLTDQFPGLHYLIRLHPNDSRPAPRLGPRGVLSAPSDSLEACLWSSNLVVVENSTVGFQAGLIGLPVFKLGNPDYPPFVACGIARYLGCLEDLAVYLSDFAALPAPADPYLEHVPSATDAVLSVIHRMLT